MRQKPKHSNPMVYVNHTWAKALRFPLLTYRVDIRDLAIAIDNNNIEQFKKLKNESEST